ncbi:MAG: hypothetical protein KatS3mg024_2724 [Armatimonadota bacterium]|nr:MAG: hypothetical protein KatS3mg024_2724 [Armatimonadota bacterium]
MTKIVFAVLAAFALQVIGGAAFAAPDVLKADNAISNPMAACCGAGKDGKEEKDKNKESKKGSRSVVSVSEFLPACGGSCDTRKKDEKQEPKAAVACGKDKKDKEDAKQPKSVMACGGSCDSKKKDEKQEPKAVFLS